MQGQETNSTDLLRNSTTESPRAFPEGPSQGCSHSPPSQHQERRKLCRQTCSPRSPAGARLLSHPALQFRGPGQQQTRREAPQAMAAAPPSGWEQGLHSPGPGHFHLNGRGGPRARQSLELDHGQRGPGLRAALLGPVRLSSWFSVPPAAPARPSPLPLPLRHFIPSRSPGPRRSRPHLPGSRAVPRDRNRGLGLPRPLGGSSARVSPFGAARSPWQRQPASGTPFGGDSTNAPLLRSPSCPPSAELFLDLYTCPSSGVSRNVFAGQALPDPQVPDLSGDSVRQQRLSLA